MSAQTKSERQFLSDYGLGLVCLHDLEGNLLSVSPALLRLLGYEANDMVGRKLSDFLAPSTRHLFPAYLEGIRSEGTASGLMRVVTKAGDDRILVYSNVLRRESGKPPYVLGHASDVTALKKSERELRINEKRFRSLVQYSSDVVLIVDPSGTIRYANTAVKRTLGYAPARIVGREIFDFIHPDDQADVQRAFGEALQRAGYGRPVEARLRTADGRYAPFETVGNNLIDNPTVGGIIVSGRDLTHRKAAERELQQRKDELERTVQQRTEALNAASHTLQAEKDIREIVEKALRDSEGKYQALINSVDGIVWQADPHTFQFTFVSKKAERLLGYPAERWLEPNFWSNHVHDEDREAAIAYCRSKTANKESHEFDYRMIAADGSSVWLRDLVSVTVDDAGNVRLSGVMVDISEQKRVDEELNRSLALLQTTLEATADGILVIDTQGKVASFNSKFARMWHIPEQSLSIGSDQTTLAFVLPQLRSPEQFVEKVRHLYASPEQSSFDVLEFKDGRVFERYSQPHRIKDAIVGRVWSFHDVTERRQLEEHLRQSQKMEAVGRLAGGIAHDFNNLLMIMMGYCGQLLAGSPSNDEVHSNATQILKAADRAAGLTKQLLAFSRKQVMDSKVLDVNTVLDEIGAMLPRIIGEDVELVTVPASQSVWVEGDYGQLEQVILNLAVNARDAMPRGGSLRLEVSLVTLDEAHTGESGSVPSGEYVLLSVRDTGKGIPREILPHIFEPFFTTKRVGEGTGLGLSTVYGIVRQSGGYIQVESEVGTGTTFLVYLPRVRAPHAIAATDEAPNQFAGGSETILLVEDEEGIRLLTRTFLEAQGYTVLSAKDGQEALRLAGEHPEPIHLLITDIVMPGIRGTELAERFCVQRPQTAVLYISGYSQQEVSSRDKVFLEKPFGMDTLAEKIREILDQRRAAAR